MKASDQALTVVQRLKSIDTALEAQGQMKIRRPGSVLLQNRQRQIMAGADCEELMPRIAGLDEDLGEIRTQRLDMGLHPDAGAPLGPNQLLGKFGGTRLPTLGPTDERLAEGFLPLPQRAPHIAIRAAQRPCSMGDRAAVGHRRQQLKERVAQRGAVLLSGLKAISQVDTQVALGNAATLDAPHFWGNTVRVG
jgi:hypothetical protein